MKMKPNFLAAGWLLLVMAVLASPAQAADSYGYPITDPYAATVIGTPSRASGSPVASAGGQP